MEAGLKDVETPKGKRKQAEGSSGVSPDLKKPNNESSAEPLETISEIDPP